MNNKSKDKDNNKGYWSTYPRHHLKQLAKVIVNKFRHLYEIIQE